jgi:hypothetical protein
MLRSDPSPLALDTAFSSQSKNSYDSVDSAYLGSFAANVTPTLPKHQLLEKIIAFLSEMPEFKSDSDPAFQQALKDLSELTIKTLHSYKDPAFTRVLKSFGWTGTRYQSEESGFSKAEFIQALSNIYLKFQFRPALSLENINDPSDINNMERIAAFCPDIVVDCLGNSPDLLLTSEINTPTYSFTGAVMLVDISGFTKFSAAMCSQGVKGLDDLRNATNGLLGQFVKAVYNYNGDGKKLTKKSN